MVHQPKFFLGYLRKALHKNYGDVPSEPLPARWIDVIKELNDRERDQEFRRRASALASRSKRRSINRSVQ